MIRSYSEMLRHSTFEDRFTYLSLRGSVGQATFGFDRWINQDFYRSRQWKQIRNYVIGRDEGSDLAFPGYEIFDRVLVHHMNPLTAEQVAEGSEVILDPEFLITTCPRTHNAIHFGNADLLPKKFVERQRGDTALW